MNSFDVKDRAVGIIGGIAVVAYLIAIALTPAHAPNSGSAGVQVVHYATVNRDQLLASDLLFALGLAVLTVFAAGLYRIIRRAEGQDGWLAIASLASVAAGAGIFGAGTALFMVVAYRPGTDPAVARAFWDARLAGLQLRGVRVRGLDRDRRSSRAQAPGAAAVDSMDRCPGRAGQPCRPVRRHGGNRCVLSARPARPGRRPHLRRVATRHLRGGLAIDPPSGHDPLTTVPALLSRRTLASLVMVGRKYTAPSTAINGNQNQGLGASAFMSAASR